MTRNRDTIPAYAYGPDGNVLTLPTLYKIVGPSGQAIHGGSGLWSLPHDGQPGEWWDITGDVKPCVNALHLTDAANFDHWYPNSGAYGPAGEHTVAVYRAEVRGLAIDAGNKWAVQSARLLPHVGGALDTSAEEAAYYAAEEAMSVAQGKADRAYDRAVAAARRAERAVKVPPAWAAYLAAVGLSGIPKGHPARAYAESAARATAAEQAAAQTRDAAVAPYRIAVIAARVALRAAKSAARLSGI